MKNLTKITSIKKKQIYKEKNNVTKKKKIYLSKRKIDNFLKINLYKKTFKDKLRILQSKPFFSMEEKYPRTLFLKYYLNNKYIQLADYFLKKTTNTIKTKNNKKIAFLLFQNYLKRKKKTPGLLKKKYKLQKKLKNIENNLIFLNNNYKKYYFSSFLKSLYGRTLMYTIKNRKKFWSYNVWYKKSIRTSHFFSKFRINRIIFLQTLYNISNRGFFFDLMVNEKTKFLAKRFLNKNLTKIFNSHWKTKFKFPWLDSLVYKRNLYNGASILINKQSNWKKKTAQKKLLRDKIPLYEKRNNVYRWFLNLIYPWKNNYIIRKDKTKRIKNVLQKIMLPFYGNISSKQYKKINTKISGIKHKIISKNDNLLGSFECRLDVAVFRLNLAPTIMWARRIIYDGNIFVTNYFETKNWDIIHNTEKKNIYPINLRNPKNLYKESNFLWKKKKYTNFKLPIKNIGYKLKPGDIIQCTPYNSNNKFKINSTLYNKPIPKHFLTTKNTYFAWSNYLKKGTSVPKNFWEKNFFQPTTAIMLFEPQIYDFQKNDRSQELFFRWMSL